jgi:hypothetical protein
MAHPERHCFSTGVNFINIYGRIFRTKFWRQSQNVTRKAAKKDIRTKKAREKMLLKLTPRLNFINGLRTAFMLVEPKSVKKTVKSTVLCFRDLRG